MRCGFFVDHQFPIPDAIAVGRHPAHPHALPARGSDLVADALGCDLALELGEGQQDVQRQPTHRRGGIERLGDGDEGHAVSVKDLDQLGKIHQRARQAVDLVNDDDIDQPVFDISQQPFQAGTLQRAAGYATVIILIADQHPALGALAGDVSLAGLPLGVQAVELLLQPFFGGFPGVDGAAQFSDNGFGHAPLRRFFRPKNTQPFQRVPVIARAMAESDL